MPANLTPQYFAAEERYKQAKDDRERLKALKEMLGVIPKHKGTEKLQADIKRKIARLKDELQDKKTKKGAKRFSYSVEKEGAAQITVVGPPNVGKSQLVNSLTNATLEVADYPFTTRIFQPAMMPYEDIQIQLVDIPPISQEYMENWIPSLIKNSDAILLVFDLNQDDLLEQIDTTIEILTYNKIELFNEKIAEQDFRWTYLKSILLGNKLDLPQAKENFNILKEFYDERFSIFPISTKDKTDLVALKQAIIQLMNIVRIYSKRPGHEPDHKNPFVFPRGSTLIDFAQAVHQDFAKNLKFARVWSKKKFDGQRITKDYILEDKDVIELHI